MYFGLLRISEVVEGAHQILARDVHIGDNKRKFLLILLSSKTLFKNMHPQSIKISSKKLEKQKRVTCQVNNEFHGLPCPYQLLKQYAVLCGGYLCDNEPFFVFADKSPLKPSQLRLCLWLLLIKSGFNHKFYGSHSLRSGRSCDLYHLGLSVETIKKLGRWKSNAVFKYLKNY